jgi:hypothetical protein
MALRSVPAWAMPTQKTKLAMSTPQPTGRISPVWWSPSRKRMEYAHPPRAAVPPVSQSASQYQRPGGPSMAATASSIRRLRAVAVTGRPAPAPAPGR